MEGEYKGAVFKLKDNEKIAIGRDANLSDIVINSNNKKVSRIHCSVMYDAKTDAYRVTDLSTNGTYDSTKSKRLLYGQEMLIGRGTPIIIGDKHNVLLLN